MRRRTEPVLACLISLAVSLAFGAAAGPASAATDLYRYTDSAGVVHFTDRQKDDRYVPIARPRGISYHRKARQNKVYDTMIKTAALTHGVPAALVKAVIAAESSFNAQAVSPKGAMGLMQLMPGTAADLGVREPFRAADNVHGGTRYLRTLHDRYGDWTRTLAAYNAGPTAVDRHRGVPPYKETREYVERVLSYYRRFHGDFAR
ncbi:MAG: lytic transglycosylase domain-containing protein [Myxococcota bacterium]